MVQMSDAVDVLPRSAIVRVEFEVALPCDASKEDILEWISYSLNESSLSRDNPLIKHELQAISEPTLSETNEYLHQEATPTERGWQIRYWKEPVPFRGRDQIDEIVSGELKGDRE